MPDRSASGSEGPLVDQLIVGCLGAIDHIRYDGPSSPPLKPRLAPFVEARPVGRTISAPEAKRSVVKHDRLPDLVADGHIAWIRVADTEAPTRQLKQFRAWRDR